MDSPSDYRPAAATPFGLGDQFEPLLREACQGRLGSVSWFRADWQRGGAKTGRGAYQCPDQSDGNATEVQSIVKIPVGPTEYLWHQRLQPNDSDPYGVTARLYDSGTSLAEYDLAWLVMERFPVGPLFAVVRNDALDLMAEVAGRFYARTAAYPVDQPPRRENWHELIQRARRNVKTSALAHENRWKKALKGISKSLDRIVEKWRGRPCETWCHGDLHPANAMSRSEQPEDPAMLIDLAEVHAGHWVEDAVYLERLFWMRPTLIEEHSPVKLISARRKTLGLPVDPEDVVLADIRRVLLAATAPAFLRSEGNPLYLDACLDVLENAGERVCERT